MKLTCFEETIGKVCSLVYRCLLGGDPVGCNKLPPLPLQVNKAGQD